MSADERAAIVRRNYEALAAGDPSPLLASIAPGYRYTAHTRNRWHGTYTIEGTLSALAETDEATGGDFSIEIVEVRPIGDEFVVAHNRVSLGVGNHRIEDADVIAVIAFEDGKVIDAVEVNSPSLNRFWAQVGDPADRAD